MNDYWASCLSVLPVMILVAGQIRDSYDEKLSYWVSHNGAEGWVFGMVFLTFLGWVLSQPVVGLFFLLRHVTVGWH